MPSIENVKDFLESPPVSWRNIPKGHTPSELSEMARHLKDIAQRAAVLGEYLDHCSGSMGTPDHDDAVKASMRTRRKVRKALGYAYPASGEYSF